MLRWFSEQESGNVGLLFGVTLPVIGMAAGLAVDQASLVRSRNELQHTADSAALAAAAKLAAAEDESGSARESMATEEAIHFVDARVPNASRTVTPSVADGTVTIVLASDEPLAFGGLFGRSAQRIRVSSTATVMGARTSGCMIALDEAAPAGVALQGSAKIAAPNCGVWSNADLRMQGAPSIRGEEICAPSGSGNAVDRAYPDYKNDCGAAADPYRQKAIEVPAKCDFTDFGFGKGVKSAVLEPGTYCKGLSISGVDVELRPGVYFIKNGPLSITSNASVTGQKVSIVMTGSGASLHMQGSPRLSLTAPTTGPLAGIALAVTDTGTEATTSELQGSPDLNLTGSVYMPGQLLSLQGSPGLKLSGIADKLVAGSFSLKGSPDVVIKARDTQEAGLDRTSLRILE